MNEDSLLRRYRLVMGFFITALIFSGLTAFPLLHELELVAKFLGIAPDASADSLSGLHYWIATVRNGLRDTYAAHPWLAYGTDWLAFGHIVIALFFIGPWRNPVANAWVLRIGLVACAMVIPTAMICGAVRDIPFYWRLIDCSFGVFGALPLLYCLRLTRKIEAASTR